MPEIFSIAGFSPLFSLQSLLPVVILLLGLYFIFARNPVSLNGRRLIRMHLYLFMFIGIVLASMGLLSLFRGSLGLVLGGTSPAPIPGPIPLNNTIQLGDPGTKSSVQELMPNSGYGMMYGTSNQGEIVYGVIVFIIGLLLALADFVALNAIEKGDKPSLLRRMTAATGVLLFSLMFLMGLTDLARDLSMSVNGEFSAAALTGSLSTIFASLPAMLTFGYLAWMSMKADLPLRRRR